MLSRKCLRIVPAVLMLVVLGGCAAEPDYREDVAGDPPEVTCQRLGDVIEELTDIDPEAMSLGDIFAHVSEGFADMQAVANDAQDTELGQSIETMRDTLNSSIASAGGDVDALGTQLRQRFQQPEVQEAAVYLQDVCGMEIPF